MSGQQSAIESPGPGAAGTDGAASGPVRRAIGLAAGAIVVAAVWIGLIPLLNHVLKYDDPIKPGQALVVAPGITFKPVPGWNLEMGLRTTDKTRTHATGSPVTLTYGAIQMKVEPDNFQGTPEQLLDLVDRRGLTNQGSTLTPTGDTFPLVARGTLKLGTAQYYTSPSSEGLIGAFVFNGTGVTFSIVGPSTQMTDQADAIGNMLVSFRYDAAKANPKSGDGK